MFINKNSIKPFDESSNKCWWRKTTMFYKISKWSMAEASTYFSWPYQRLWNRFIIKNIPLIKKFLQIHIDLNAVVMYVFSRQEKTSNSSDQKSRFTYPCQFLKREHHHIPSILELLATYTGIVWSIFVQTKIFANDHSGWWPWKNLFNDIICFFSSKWLTVSWMILFILTQKLVKKDKYCLTWMFLPFHAIIKT